MNANTRLVAAGDEKEGARHSLPPSERTDNGAHVGPRHLSPASDALRRKWISIYKQKGRAPVVTLFPERHLANHQGWLIYRIFWTIGPNPVKPHRIYMPQTI